MNTPDGFSLQAEDPKLLSNIDLNKIHFIEQDMWAEGIGEYVKCPCCNTIFSKKDIFGHLKKDIYIETVGKIQQILNIDSIKCKKCDSYTDFIWGGKYLEEIKKRYQDEKSFLTTMRNDRGEILGFTDGYINNFDTIYKREFEYYYSDIGIDKIKEMIKKQLLGEFPELFLMHSTTGIEKKYSTLKNFISILNYFYNGLMTNGYENITGIYESQIGSMAHSIYHICGGKQIGINKAYFTINNLYNKNKSDIFIHEGIITSANNKLSIGIKEFIKLNSKAIKKVINR